MVMQMLILLVILIVEKVLLGLILLWMVLLYLEFQFYQRLLLCLLQKLSMLQQLKLERRLFSYMASQMNQVRSRREAFSFHSKSKHIQTKYHFIRYLVKDKLVILEKIYESKNQADMLTKGVTIEKLKLCATSVGLLA